MKHKFQISNLKFQNKEGGSARHARQLAGVAGGQALTTLLFFVIIAVTITAAAVIMIIANATSTSKIQEGVSTYYAAESGIENALLRLLREPNYTGEILSIGSSTVTISVSGSNPKIVEAVSENGNFKRIVQADMTYNSGLYTFSNWKEM